MMRRCEAVGMLLAVLLAGSLANATEPPILSPDEAVFILGSAGVYRSGHPDEHVKIGETLSLKDVGRRFSSSSVSAAYEQGEDEVEFFKVSSEGAEVRLHYDESGQITQIETNSPGVADVNGVRVGDSVVSALGDRTFCNTHGEDEPAWCKATENADIRYDVDWSDTCSLTEATASVIDVPACARIAAISITGAPPSRHPQFSFSDFAEAVFMGRTKMPNFTGRDKDYRDYRTRITNSLREGPNFAGEFSLLQFGCGTGCSAVFVSSNRSGEVFSAPVGGEENLYLGLMFEKNSRLLAAQWASLESDTCNVEWFEWTGREAKRLAGSVVGPVDACLKSIPGNLGR